MPSGECRPRFHRAPLQPGWWHLVRRKRRNGWFRNWDQIELDPDGGVSASSYDRFVRWLAAGFWRPVITLCACSVMHRGCVILQMNSLWTRCRWGCWVWIITIDECSLQFLWWTKNFDGFLPEKKEERHYWKRVTNNFDALVTMNRQFVGNLSKVNKNPPERSIPII